MSNHERRDSNAPKPEQRRDSSPNLLDRMKEDKFESDGPGKSIQKSMFKDPAAPDGGNKYAGAIYKKGEKDKIRLGGSKKFVKGKTKVEVETMLKREIEHMINFVSTNARKDENRQCWEWALQNFGSIANKAIIIIERVVQQVKDKGETIHIKNTEEVAAHQSQSREKTRRDYSPNPFERIVEDKFDTNEISTLVEDYNKAVTISAKMYKDPVATVEEKKYTIIVYKKQNKDKILRGGFMRCVKGKTKAEAEALAKRELDNMIKDAQDH
ncbi:uncharacterized protein FOMMEDRAFT_32149 [Fomitiporia mediterranea MF3/22]|uniref:uncharacterized protein n=1 Tax=Fomitiporia mediterranea (strain MF3/22) TaxID=694068 RepID=UPI0004407755|nr:uncharacterized protein FOMMEDRAFT_32149 [Fomitiporia mediterranea MF3/22]EJC97917.1 hypothetical protein FOMMEDRAFT_32149 [Fomitiporia mediterranea MF3/22]